jgi:hypothetical protein
MSQKVHMVIGEAAALPGSNFPVGEKRAFIFLYLTSSADEASAEVAKFMSENRWERIKCHRTALLDVEKLSSHDKTVQDAYLTAAKGKPSVIIFLEP